MAVTLGLKNGGVTGGRALDKDSLIGTRKRATLTYVVMATDISEGTDDILAATNLPSLRALSESGYIIEKVPREIDSAALLWEVDVIIDSHVDVSSAVGNGANRNFNWSWDSETLETVIHRDPITGEPMVNSANEPVLVTAPMAIPILNVERIEDSFSPSTILQYKNKVNSTTFLGAPPKTALMADIKDSPVDQNGVMKRRVSYVIKFNLQWDYDAGEFLGWQIQYLNEGTRFIPPGKKAPNYEFFVDRRGNRTRGNLKANGNANTVSGHIPSTGPGDYTQLPPNYIKRNRFLQTSFAPLQLGPFT